jgi:hypothetical protein
MNGLTQLSSGMGHQSIADLILNVTRADTVHPFVDGLPLQLYHAVLGEAGQRLAIVQLELMQERQVGVFGLHSVNSTSPRLAILSSLSKLGDLDLRQGDADQVLPLLADYFAAADILAQIALHLAGASNTLLRRGSVKTGFWFPSYGRGSQQSSRA